MLCVTAGLAKGMNLRKVFLGVGLIQGRRPNPGLQVGLRLRENLSLNRQGPSGFSRLKFHLKTSHPD